MNHEQPQEDVERIVATRSLEDFHTHCQTLLDRGYVVIPGTVVVQVAYSSASGMLGNFVAFFRKPTRP